MGEKKQGRQTLYHIPGWCGTITLASQTGKTDGAGHVIPGAYYVCRPSWAGPKACGVIDLDNLTEEEWHGIEANFKPVVKLTVAKDADAAKAAEAAGKKIVINDTGTFIEETVKDEIDLVIGFLNSYRRVLNLIDGPPPPKPVEIGNLTAKEKAKLLEDRKAEQKEWQGSPGPQRVVQKVTHGAATAGK